MPASQNYEANAAVKLTIPTDATHYAQPSCPELKPHTVGPSEDGRHLVMTLAQKGAEAKLPLVPMRGQDFKDVAGNTQYVTGPKKHVLTRLSGLLRGHGSPGFLQRFDDNLYVHVSDLMDELQRVFPNEFPQPLSIRTWIGIVANDAKSRYSTLCVQGLEDAEAIGFSHCPIKIRAAQGHQASLMEGKNPTTLARIVYCKPEHHQFYESDLVQHGNTRMPKRISHRTTASAAESIIKFGVIPGGAGGSESGRRHAFFSSTRVGESGYVSGVRADAPIEIAVDLPKAVESGVDFILTDSDAILTAQHVPNSALLWAIDDRNKITLWTPPSIDEKGEGQQTSDSATAQGASSSARPSSKPEAEAVNVVPVGVAVKIEDNNQATVSAQDQKAIFEASAQSADPKYPVLSGFFVQVSTSPCPRCQFEVIDGMMSCGQCPYVIQGRKASGRDSLFRQRRAEFLAKIAKDRGVEISDEQLLKDYSGQDFAVRGSASPVANLIRRSKDRRDIANRAGFWNVMHRFKTDNTYAAIMTATGRNEDDIAEIDLMSVLHLPQLNRTQRERIAGTGPFASMSYKERQNLAQLAFCEAARPNQIDPVFAEKMQYYPWMIFWHGKLS